jgi:protease-4
MLPRASTAVDNVVTGIGEARRRRNAGLVLELDLTEPLIEGVPADPLSALLARRRTSLRVVVEALRRAASDDRVRALVVRLGGTRSPLRLAQAQEVGAAVSEFGEHGKATVAWAETFGEFHNGSAAYHLATSFEEIWLQPSGDLSLNGVAAAVPFVRGTLDKLGVTPQFAQRHEYKNAANLFTERGFTDAHREATEGLVGSLMDQLVTGIAAHRGLDPAAVRAAVDRAPLIATEALELGFVDRLGYREDVYDAVRERVGADTVQQYVGRYARPTPATMVKRMAGNGDTVALVHVTGPIHLGPSGRHRLPVPSTGSDTVVAALRSATKAPDVKAVVLRVASPGGSYVASDTIWHEVDRTRRAGKPVIVSMGDVAASGGYFVSMGADVIVAEPATLTGSIGVVAGKQVVDALAGRIGVGYEGVSEGRHARMFSAMSAFSDEEWERLNALLDRIYDDFTAKVASGRALPAERVDAIARGRVWTGADAKQHGLVDELGGLRTALELAKQRGGIPESVEIEPRVYPKVQLVSRLRPPQSSEDPAAASARFGFGVQAWGPFNALALRLGLSPYGPLTLPIDLDVVS